MTPKQCEKIVKRLLEEDSKYGRLIRWTFALKWIKFEPYYKGKEIKEEEQDYLFGYDYFLQRLTFHICEAYDEHITMKELKNWSMNFYLKAKGSEATNPDTPKEMVEIATEFKQDFDDVIEGRCDHWFTEEMRKAITVKVVEL